MVVAENIRLEVEQEVFSEIGQGIVTITIGIATYPDTCDNWEILERRADEIAMKAKKIKKNSVSSN